MIGVDARGCGISGATPKALEAYEQALAALQSWRSDADAHVQVARGEAPGFVMAHVLQAHLSLNSRDPRRVQAARPALAQAARLPSNARERHHVAAIEAVLADDYEGAKRLLDEALRMEPRDVLALQAAHALDYLTGDVARIESRVAAALPAWSRELPGYPAVLAMHAFGLEERGEYVRAEQTARAALALDERNARAHHVMAHVFEMTQRPAAGARWMNEHVAGWALESVVGTHCWWHLALFRTAQGQFRSALALYDQHLRRSDEVSDLIDSSSLLWRLLLRGCDTGARFRELADAWATHIDDAFCTFSDLHAMLAFVGARDWVRAEELEGALRRRRSLSTRYGATTRMLGAPACSAVIAFGRGEPERALDLFASLPPVAYRIGGSHAQRDVLNLTLLAASEQIRSAARRLRVAAPPVRALA